MAKNKLARLEEFGQSPWIDFISRELLESGALRGMIERDGLKGLTSNPTIFDKAISKGSDYDEGIRRALAKGLREPSAVFEDLALRDIRDAADLLLPVYKRSAGADGFVSLEVSPRLAYDTRGTIAEAERLFAQADRPNLMIKVPGTPEGLPAVERLIAAGINVNVTLIFSVARHREVMEAYLKGLEARAAAGRPLAVASVASFFVSRIDSAVDKLLEQKRPGSSLEGKTAIANAKEAYRAFREVFGSERFARLARKGARVQRPLWASTSTKNPSYPRTLYVDALIGRDTVNTLPLETWEAFRAQGELSPALEEAPEGARQALADLARCGIDLSAVTAELEQQGVAAFVQSFESLLAAISAKIAALEPSEKKTAAAPKR